MALFDTIKTDAQKQVEGLMGDIFSYQTTKLLNAPVLARLSGAPTGNLTAAQIEKGQTGQAAGIPSGNSNGSLSNSVDSPWIKNKFLWIGIAAIALILIVVLIKRR